MGKHLSWQNAPAWYSFHDQILSVHFRALWHNTFVSKIHFSCLPGLILDNKQSNQNPVVVLRMLGTTAQSSDIVQTLQSVSQQIAVNFDQSDFQMPTDAQETVKTFQHLLSLATPEKPQFLFLDSLDQLSAKNGTYKMTWMPRSLPDHVVLVLSTLPNTHNILTALQDNISPDALWR